MEALVKKTAVALYPRLSGMMFLQFAVWGAWSVTIGGHMGHLGFTGKQISYVFGTTAFGSLISPLIAGWIADRFMPAQWFTALSHLAGAALLYVAWQQTEFWPLWAAMFFYAMLYMPTLALTNAVAFYHMGESSKFGQVRVWGTIGWIAVQWFLTFYLRYYELHDANVSHTGDALLIAGICALAMGLYSLTLPNTPPTKAARNPYAFVEALQLMANRNFAVLLVISFIVAIELPFYYNLTFLFLTEQAGGVGLAESTAQFGMSLGQVGELLLMLLLWPSLRRLGMRTTIFLGILGWPVRYAIFAIGHPAWLILAAQTLHGICYSFFFVGGMIAVEQLSHRDIRASAQSLILFATNGLGMLVGHFVSGQVHDYFMIGPDHHRWVAIFTVPIVITIIAGIAFLATFNEQRYKADAAKVAEEDLAAAAGELTGA
jgi:nucleoside transporter